MGKFIAERLYIDWGILNSMGSADNERLVTPSIVYAFQSMGDLKGSMIAIGWWSWAIRLTIIKKSPSDPKTVNEQPKKD